MKKEIETFSNKFIKELGEFIKKSKQENTELTENEFNMVITTAFYLLGKNKKHFSEKVNLENKIK